MSGLLVPSLCAGLLLLIGVDLKISTMRWKLGFKDLNPLVQHGLSRYGVLGAQAALLALNGSILIILASFPTLLSILFGAKLALATIQLRSLIEYGKHSG